MKLAVTGGTGLVGRFIVNESIAAGDEVTVLARTPPVQGFFDGKVAFQRYSLSDIKIDLNKFDAVIHAAFSHVPGYYRGGEGNNAAGFRFLNLDGSIRLFNEAARIGLRIVFLSSRAVYGPGSGALHESMSCNPDTLYGQVKLQSEHALLASGQPATILRATGVYGVPGAGQQHKWAKLFSDFAAGRKIASRVGTEVHGKDLASAVRLGLQNADGVYNVSDILLDRHELLRAWRSLTGIEGDLPQFSDSSSYNQMNTDRLLALGWKPGGRKLLHHTLRHLAVDSNFEVKDA